MSAGSSTSESRDMRANLIFIYIIYEMTESPTPKRGGREEAAVPREEVFPKKGFTFAFLP